MKAYYMKSKPVPPNTPGEALIYISGKAVLGYSGVLPRKGRGEWKITDCRLNTWGPKLRGLQKVIDGDPNLNYKGFEVLEEIEIDEKTVEQLLESHKDFIQKGRGIVMRFSELISF